MSHSHSSKAILYAFLANLGIAIIKAGAALWTGSGALLAEAIHSLADCGNQVLLFIGMRRSESVPTAKHPMGFGREAYIWSMMVAITLFSVGGLFSIYEGWQRVHESHQVENAEIALAILVLAVVMEAWSLRGALAAVADQRQGGSLWQWFKATHSSELMVVIGEDLAALFGLLLAAIALGATLLTGDSRFDALGSMFIGLLLVIVAFLISREVHSLLLGEADMGVRDQVGDWLSRQADVRQVFNLWAINHGQHVMLAIKVELTPELTVAEAVMLINNLEIQIKRLQPRVKWIFFEIDNCD